MDRKFVKVYPSGKRCPHCIWISEDQQDFFTLIPEKDLGFHGITVIDSHNFFKNTFNCVHGIKEGNIDTNHDYTKIGSLLYGSVIFIESLHLTFGIKRCRLLINSHISKKYGSKEHLHALVTLSDEDEKIYEQKMNQTYKHKLKVADKLWGNILDLSAKECSELIRSMDNALDYIVQKIKKTTGQDFDPEKNGFYILLQYVREKSCNSVITGQIAF